MRIKIFATILAAVVILLIILLAVTSPVDPVAYHPPKKPAMTGALTPNDLLARTELIAAGRLDGPEDIAFDAAGRLYTGTADGAVMRTAPGGAPEVYARTGGRVLGLMFDRSGALLACDASRGLVSIDRHGASTLLADSAEGVKFRATDALDIARDGSVYFTDASDTFPLEQFKLDMIEARPHGRLMRYDPATKKVTVLLRGLCFANGVALSRGEDFVLVNETYRYRVWRYWLKGPKAGTAHIFIDNLPGMPDNITSNDAGTFWLALFTVRNDALDMVQGHPFIKSVLGSLPESLWAHSARYGLVVSLDERGRITGSLQDPGGAKLYDITTAREHGGFLYFGSLTMDKMARYKLGR